MVAHPGKSLCDVGLVHFAAWGLGSARRTGSGEPQDAWIELEQSRGEGGGIAELEAQLQGGQLRRRTGEQQVTVTDGVQGAGTAEGAANLMAANGLSDMVHHDKSGAEIGRAHV